MLATVITLTQYEALMLGVVIEAALQEMELRAEWGAAARACAALAEHHAHGFFPAPIELTEVDCDAARICWEALALSYPQVGEAHYHRVLRKLLVG